MRGGGSKLASIPRLKTTRFSSLVNPYRFIQPLRSYAVKKFCGKCKKELPQDAKYLLCNQCHKNVALADDDREFTENSRVHWR